MCCENIIKQRAGKRLQGRPFGLLSARRSPGWPLVSGQIRQAEKLVRVGGLEPPQDYVPTDFHTTTVFTARQCRFVVWTIPSP